MTKRLLKTLVLEMDENCYLFYDENKECLIIDPGSRTQEIISTIKGLQLKPLAILLTHGHFDHISSVDDLRAQFNIECYMHGNEKYFLVDPEMNGSSVFGLPPVILKEADKLITSDELLEIGEFRIKAIHTPGHTSGGVCYYDAAAMVVFTGDTLFRQGIGRTDLYSGNYKDLISSIRTKLLTLPEDTVVLPGHGPSSTIGAERSNSPFI